MSDKMSKEDMVKEAVEEAKAKAAEAEQTKEELNEPSEEAGQDMSETAGDTAGPEEIEAGEDGSDAGDDAEEQASKSGKKTLFGKKNKKDKKDEKIEELTDRLTRQMAEFDNFRKRTEKEKAAMFEMGARDILEKILPVVDNFERGLAAIPEEAKGGSFATGMEMIYKQLMKMLEDAGVTPIEAVGKEFDPNFHNAVMHVEDENLGENVVAAELQKGYMYRSTVIRHSMVQVAN